MERCSVDVKKQFIPHPMQLFLVGTRDEAGTPHFGMFCWLSFCWDKELSVSLCMDGQKATKDHIRQRGTLSACLVTEQLLPLADKIAHSSGEEKKRLLGALPWQEGPALGAPLLEGSPLCYELELKQTIPLEGSEIFICRIKNALVDKALTEKNAPYDLAGAAPVAVSQNGYFGLAEKGKVGQMK